MHWLLIGYLFLFIHRPFEVWPWLGDLHVERVYMLGMIAVWLVAPKRVLPNGLHLAYAAFAFAVAVTWAVSPWAAQGQMVVENWFKILVFYALLVTSVYDEKGLKRVTAGFLAVMTIYLLHSLREYVGGRSTYRMGINRMLGVDTSLGDPNSFGASIVFALPFAAAFWRANVGGRTGKVALTGYVGLSVLCVLLTGSRSSLLGVAVWCGLLVLGGRRKWLYVLGIMAAAPLVFVALPESLQTRFETIINPDVGPANAKESGEGRIEGLLTGLELWAANPATGIGPGAWRPATRSTIESHNLYGQLLGETGTLGAVAFAAVLIGFRSSLKRVKAVRKSVPEWQNDLVFQIAAAVGTGVFLMLFMGNFGHNLFRYSWLWYGGFLVIARYCVDCRLRDWVEPEPEEIEDPEPALAARPVPRPGEHWQRHSGHSRHLWADDDQYVEGNGR